MTFEELEVVVLNRDIPEHQLHRGVEGTVVWVHSPDQYEVEFMDDEGETIDVVTVSAADLSPSVASNGTPPQP
jgi:Domain of unknown function (DUF4926)